jgi:hypothetical protein
MDAKNKSAGMTRRQFVSNSAAGLVVSGLAKRVEDVPSAQRSDTGAGGGPWG